MTQKIIKKKIDPNLILAFRQIAPLLNEKIVLEAALEIGCDYATVTEYLHGTITDNRLGNELLEVVKIRLARHYATLGQNPIRQTELMQKLIENLDILNKRLDQITYIVHEAQELFELLLRKANIEINSKVSQG